MARRFRCWNGAGWRPRCLLAAMKPPSTCSPWVCAILRLEGSVQGLLRVARRDIEIDGVLIPKGANVVLCAGSANRDPARWEDPESFKLDRPECRRHLTFGHGRHACVGMQLARREMQ